MISERARVMADAALMRIGDRLKRDDDYRRWWAAWSDHNIYNKTTVYLTILDAGLAELKIVRQWKSGPEPPGPFTTVRADDIVTMIEAAESYVGGELVHEEK